MFRPPVAQILESCSNVLLVGMGGGYDVFTGVILYEELSSYGAHVHFASLSFKHDLRSVKHVRQVSDGCMGVRYADYIDAGVPNAYEESLGYPRNYFPEFHLSKWLHGRGTDAEVFCFDLYGGVSAAQYTAGLQKICDEKQIDCVVLVDAGIDSLLRHDEEYMGTWEEDTLSVLAVQGLKRVKHKILQAVGLGSEGRLSEHDFLENLAAMKRARGFLGGTDLMNESAPCVAYRDAVMSCIPTNTTINMQILSSLEGNYGNVCPEEIRSRGVHNRDCWMQPLMSHAYFFNVDVLCDYKLFMGKLSQAKNLEDLRQIMDKCRLDAGIESPHPKIKNHTQYSHTRKFQYMFDRNRMNSQVTASVDNAGQKKTKSKKKGRK